MSSRAASTCLVTAEICDLATLVSTRSSASSPWPNNIDFVAMLTVCGSQPSEECEASARVGRMSNNPRAGKVMVTSIHGYLNFKLPALPNGPGP